MVSTSTTGEGGRSALLSPTVMSSTLTPTLRGVAQGWGQACCFASLMQRAEPQVGWSSRDRTIAPPRSSLTHPAHPSSTLNPAHRSLQHSGVDHHHPVPGLLARPVVATQARAFSSLPGALTCWCPRQGPPRSGRLGWPLPPVAVRICRCALPARRAHRPRSAPGSPASGESVCELRSGGNHTASA
jgi:hypothetical protein